MINEPEYIELSYQELIEAIQSYVVNVKKSPYGIMSVITDLYPKYIPNTVILGPEQRYVVKVEHENYVR